MDYWINLLDNFLTELPGSSNIFHLVIWYTYIYKKWLPQKKEWLKHWKNNEVGIQIYILDSTNNNKRQVKIHMAQVLHPFLSSSVAHMFYNDQGILNRLSKPTHFQWDHRPWKTGGIEMNFYFRIQILHLPDLWFWVRGTKLWVDN